MKILIIGNPDSKWLVDFVKNCVLPIFDDITIFGSSAMETHVDSVYTDNDIEVIRYLPEAYLQMGKLGWPFRAYRRWRAGKKLLKKGSYDVINIQYVGLCVLIKLAEKIAKKTNARIIWSYWGDDLNAASDYRNRRKGKHLTSVDFVTFSSLNLRSKFEGIYSTSNVLRETVPFGLSMLDLIDEMELTENCTNSRQQLKLPLDKVIVSIGYNGIRKQNHIEVLDALQKLSPEVKENLFLLFQMTYGSDDSYHDSVEKKARKLGFPYRSYREFLPDKSIVQIRMATDIYINAQTTDAFASSVYENFYCGNVIFNAKWLRYKELAKYNIQYIEFHDFGNLTKQMQDYFEGRIAIDTSLNRMKIGRSKKWKCLASRWIDVLRGEY